MGHFCDGRASLVVGTHTHIPTADAQILPGGTAYQTDAGACADYDSVIGMDKHEPLQRFTTKMPGGRFSPATGPATLCGVFVETGAKGLADAHRAGAPWRAPETDPAGIAGKPEAPMPPFTLRKLDHVVLRVQDLEKSLAFYQAACSAVPLDKVQERVGLCQVRAGESLIDLVPLDGMLGKMGGAGPGAEARNVDHFAIQVTPFDEPAIRAHLAAHSVEITDSGMRYGAEGDGPSIYIKDPDGNTVELKGPAAR